MQNTSSAVMAQRVEAPDSLDFFPTPPWATRALCEIVLREFRLGAVWEPACGEGHMSETLREYAVSVFASDVHDYGRGQQGEGPRINCDDGACYEGGRLTAARLRIDGDQRSVDFLSVGRDLAPEWREGWRI